MKDKSILHICSNYTGTKIFPNLLKKLNTNFGDNYLFCPKKYSESDNKYSYLDSENKIFSENEKFVKICKCFSKLDTFLFFPKRKKITKTIVNCYNIENFSAVFAHSLFTDGWVANKLYKKFNLPFSVFVQNSDINVFFKIPVIKRLGIKILLNAKRIVFCSDKVKNEVFKKCLSQKIIAKLENKALIIPFGIEALFIENRLSCDRNSISGKNIKVVTVGTIDRNKNQIVLAKAINLLRQKNIKIEYILVGKSVDNKYLNEILEFPFVKYLGTKTYIELIEIYRNCDIFALTSKHETFGLVYAEAMTQGLPLIYSENQGFDGQFDEGEVGYSVNPEDIADVAEKIERITKNYVYLSRRANNFSVYFDWDKVAYEYYKAITGF